MRDKVIRKSFVIREEGCGSFIFRKMISVRQAFKISRKDLGVLVPLLASVGDDDIRGAGPQRNDA